MDKIKSELTAIIEKRKKDFEKEINGEKAFKTIIDITTLIDKYELNLQKLFSDIFSNQAKYIDNNDKTELEEFIRHLILDFRKYASAFLLR